MRDHSECEEAICTAMARGKHGTAEYLAARCDLRHGPELTTPTHNEAATEGVTAESETA